MRLSLLNEDIDKSIVDKIHKLIKAYNDLPDGDEAERIYEQINKLKVHKEEYEEARNIFDRDNRGKPGYEEWIRKSAQREKRRGHDSDNLIIWMLRHLKDRAERGV